MLNIVRSLLWLLLYSCNMEEMQIIYKQGSINNDYSYQKSMVIECLIVLLSDSIDVFLRNGFHATNKRQVFPKNKLDNSAVHGRPLDSWDVGGVRTKSSPLWNIFCCQRHSRRLSFLPPLFK